MPNRSIVHEIEELKKRHGGYYPYPLLHNWQSATDRIYRLQQSFDWAKSQLHLSEVEELLKHIPVGLIATLESFFKGVISQLIDFGSPFLERVQNLKNIRFDTEHVIAIPQKRVSIGELVSHHLEINNLNAILAYMKVLTEQDFWNSLKKVVDRESKEIFLRDPDKAFQSIEEMFRIRHIIAHEMRFYVHPELSSIEEGLKNVLDMINATGEFTALLMNIPVTIPEKVQYAASELSNLKTELETLTQEFRTRAITDSMLEIALKDFNDETETWERFVKLHQSLEGYLTARGGGQMGAGYDLAIMDVETSLTRARINSLKFWLTGRKVEDE
jgi:hypothetical protein